MTEAPRDPAERKSPVRSPLEFAGGLFLIAIAAVGFIGAYPLPFGQLSGIGSGLLPKVVATLVACFGAFLLLQALVIPGDELERWGVRGPIMVLGAVLAFAFTVRPLGLVVAGPVAFVVAALADRETRPLEVVSAALAATVAWASSSRSCSACRSRSTRQACSRPCMPPMMRSRRASRACCRAFHTEPGHAVDGRSLQQSGARARRCAVPQERGAVLPGLPDRHADRRAARRGAHRHHHHAAAG